MDRVVLKFWFEELSSAQWWVADPILDVTIRERFGSLHTCAAEAELSDWRSQPQGRLAEIIVLDQFSRNLYRDTARAFAQDSMALALAQEAIRSSADTELSPVERSFLYMPFMHSESPRIHVEALKLFEANGVEASYEFELRHKAVIDRFGRYPHRNAILGRPSTAAELAFLEEPGSRF